MSGSSLTVLSAPLSSPTALRLIDALDAELAERFPDMAVEVHVSNDEVSGSAGTFLIAYQAGKPVGCGAVRRLHDTVAEILRMYVHPDERNQGVGASILAALEDEARELGYSELILETADRLPESIALYEHSGYTHTEARNPLLGTHSVFMRKPL